MPRKKTKETVVKKPAKKTIDKYICIDYPQENEVILPGEYSIRIGASSEFAPEVSINGSGWVKCRQGGGYWWFDWAGFSEGIHSIEARLCGKNGKAIKVINRSCMCKS